MENPILNEISHQKYQLNENYRFFLFIIIQAKNSSFLFKIKNSVAFEDLLQAQKPELIRISHEKTRDIKYFQKYDQLIPDMK